MNKQYRIVWNESTSTWVAVAEIASAHGKSKGTCAGVVNRVVLWALQPIALAMALWCGPVHAAPPAVTQLPTGGQVVAGQATLQQAGNAVLNVNQTSGSAVINWNTFNLGSAATVNFVQPNSSAAVLNRVLDANPSQIYGRITAPGQVFFTNASGMYFAPSASVDVGSFTATTHNISTADFMAGNYRFTRDGATGTIVNDGHIQASLGGYVALLAPEVRNHGVVMAQMGSVALAAGETYQLQIQGSRLSHIDVTPATIATLVENGQAVLAPEGWIILSAKAADQLQASVVNTGQLAANSLVERGGRIVLESSGSITAGGTIDASGKTGGGSVTLNGTADALLTNDRKDVVRLTGLIDASSASGQGGSIHIGGDSLALASANGGAVSASGNRYVFAYQPTVTFTSTNASKTYGSTYSFSGIAPTVTGVAAGVSGAFQGDTQATAFSGAASLSSSGASATATVAGGPYAISVGAGTLTALNGYALAYSSSGQLTIDRAPLTVTGDTKSVTYNGSAQTNTFTTSTLYGSDSVTGVSGSASGTNASTTAYADSLSSATGTGLSNYTISYVNGGLTINPATLTVSPTLPTLTVNGANNSVTYNGSLQKNWGATMSGQQGSDSFSITGYASGINAGTYTDALSVTGNGSTLLSNYTVSVRNGSLTINRAPLTVTGATKSVTYNGVAQTNTFTTSTLYGSDSVTSVSGKASGTNAGTYTDSLSGATGSGLDNYNITYANGSMTINPAALAVLTVSGVNNSVTYNGSLQKNWGATMSGQQGSDSFSITGYASGINAGTYTDALSVTGNGSTLLSNYAVSVHNGSLTINRAPLTVTGATKAVTYNGVAQTNTFTTSTLYGSDSVTGVSGLASGILLVRCLCSYGSTAALKASLSI